MTPEMIQTALATVAEDSVRRSAILVMLGHCSAIAGIAAGLPKGAATEAIDQAIAMLTESRDAIKEMK